MIKLAINNDVYTDSNYFRKAKDILTINPEENIQTIENIQLFNIKIVLQTYDMFIQEPQP